MLVRERHEFEERRLAYVAVTRARHSLLLSGSYWATQTKPRGPSPFLAELAASGVIGPLPGGSQNEVNPLGDEVDVMLWPADPLGGRRARVEAAAEAVRSADPGTTGTWAPELELLLAERAARLDSARYVALPNRVPASRFKDFVTDPAAVASSLRRPMPEKPYRATRLGTLFHSWVEQRAGVGGSFEELDTLATESDTEQGQLDAAALAALQATFEQSPWAGLAPIEVEREIHLVLDGQIVICKIDAVYAVAAPDGTRRFQVVDWKTGKAPKRRPRPRREAAPARPVSPCLLALGRHRPRAHRCGLLLRRRRPHHRADPAARRERPGCPLEVVTPALAERTSS